MVQLQKRRIFAALVCSEAFEGFARTQARVLGAPDLPLLIVPHPVAGLSMAEVRQRAQAVVTDAITLVRPRA